MESVFGCVWLANTNARVRSAWAIDDHFPRNRTIFGKLIGIQMMVVVKRVIYWVRTKNKLSATESNKKESLLFWVKSWQTLKFVEWLLSNRRNWSDFIDDIEFLVISIVFYLRQVKCRIEFIERKWWTWHIINHSDDWRHTKNEVERKQWNVFVHVVRLEFNRKKKVKLPLIGDGKCEAKGDVIAIE